MKHVLFVIILLMDVLQSFGEDFNTHWIHSPQPDSLSHVWFRRLYVTSGRPQQAFITVSTTGYVKLYINECNIGTSCFFPLRYEHDDSPQTITVDITSYLRNDSNVVALIYSPTRPSVNNHQIAINIYGIDHDGKQFSRRADESWLCRNANSRLSNDDGEIVDGRAQNDSWNDATIYDIALWRHAQYEVNECQQQYEGVERQPEQQQTGHRRLWQFQKLYPAIITRTTLDRESFFGFPRATIREARYGEVIKIGKLKYICRGEIDEQAYPVFGAEYIGDLNVSGSSRFSRSHITDLEAVSLSENRITKY